MTYPSVTVNPTSVSCPESPAFSYSNINNSLVVDGTVATAPGNGQGGGMPSLLYLFHSELDPRAIITGVMVTCVCSYSGPDNLQWADRVATLVKGGTEYESTTNFSNIPLTTSLASYTNGSSTDLFGTTWQVGDFIAGNVSLHVSIGDHADPSSGTLSVDGTYLTIYYTLGDTDTMDNFHAKGRWTVLFSEALPSLSSSASLFPAAQTGSGNRATVNQATMAVVTVRGAGLTVRTDGGTATAGANGTDYAIGGPYQFPINISDLANVNAIQNGGSATGWVEYWASLD